MGGKLLILQSMWVTIGRNIMTIIPTFKKEANYFMLKKLNNIDGIYETLKILTKNVKR